MIRATFNIARYALIGCVCIGVTACSDSPTSPTTTTSTTASTGTTSATTPPTSGSGSSSSATGAYTLNGGTASTSGQAYGATQANQSAILVSNSGVLTLASPTITKIAGDSSSAETSSQYGQNAGLLVTSAGKVTITGGSVTTSALGANGLFATGTSSSVTMTGGTITTTGEASHGIDVTYGGTITLNDVNVTTSGASASAALSTDFGGGTLNITGGVVRTSGLRSPAIYSTGTVTVTGTTMTASGGPGGVIDGANSIRLVNASLTGSNYGIEAFRSAPATGPATITVSGGRLQTTAGDVFVVRNQSSAAVANITVSNGATLSASTGTLVNATGGSTANFTGEGVTLSGNMIADSTSTTTVTLRSQASLSGTLTNAALTLDGTSRWTVTAASTLTTLSNDSGISGTSITNIVGNGFTVTYDATAAGNSALGGRTFTLVNGGQLKPR